ncbi:MAG: hypothetical protein ABFR65_09210 [Pseudomonadota bacterium]
MKLKTMVLSSVILFSGGCASLDRPAENEFASLPVIQFGNSVPTDGKYILHFPHGVPIDTPVTFGGNLFTADDAKVLTVTPKDDIYVYQEWVSYDRKNWHQADKTMKADLQLKLPGYYHPKAGYLDLRLDRKE